MTAKDYVRVSARAMEGVDDGNESALRVADLFCGAGGSSTGAEKAINAAGRSIELVAVNHWQVAVETHQLNHPKARHYVQDLDGADPEALVPEGYLDLLMASPECRYFSRARGGKPIHDQGRMSPWIIHRWLTSLDIRNVLIENVPEFVGWGPLDKNLRPDKARRGLYFQEWVRSFWGLGYNVEWRMLNAADFGEATTRVRFFLQARKDGLPIHWPEATHAKADGGSMLGELPSWRGAREVIDWGNPGRSLMDDPKYQRKPLSVNTRRRIARGLQRFGGPLAQMYIDLLDLPEDSLPSETGVSDKTPVPRPFHGSNRQNTAPRSMNDPVPTLTTWGNGGAYMVQPVVQPLNGLTHADAELSGAPYMLGQQSGAAARSTDQPVPTVAAAGAIALVRPIVTEYYGNGSSRPVADPLSTVTTKARHGLTQPTLIQVGQPDSVEPDKSAVHAYVVPNFGEREGQPPRVHSIDDPVPTVTSRGAGSLVSPVVGELSEEQAEQVDPRRLVLVDGHPYLLDIRYRMLQNPELARAMGFSDDETAYEFVGNVAQVTKQIGNAVPVRLAAALVKAMLAPVDRDPLQSPDVRELEPVAPAA